MTRGTKSWLWGAHHWLIHSYYVAQAWTWLYGRRPTWRQLVAIALHDIGYIGCRTIDGEDGEQHPAAGYSLTRLLVGEDAADQVLGHSQSYSRALRRSPSMLCWADKLGTALWLERSPFTYLRRTRATGELAEYRQGGHDSGFMHAHEPDWKWAMALSRYLRHKAVSHAPSSVLSTEARIELLRLMRMEVA